ncbi:hypothetical protein LY78DRAFT_663304 [Colletotrichum sublineola]|nr:hypothetical protein LY78DRAFT_663304 [Colletotrichum sublineola]
MPSSSMDCHWSNPDVVVVVVVVVSLQSRVVSNAPLVLLGLAYSDKPKLFRTIGIRVRYRCFF